jgi:glycine/D-amino acid oxidase-like deaminating enzyme
MGNVLDEGNVPVWAAGGDDSRETGPALPRLTSTVDADVCVIGLGGSGLTCVGELLEAGVSPARIVGVDAGSVASGAAGRNGGFLLAGTADFYHDAIAKFGHDRARRLYQLTIDQIDEIARKTPSAVRRLGSLRIASSAEERQDCLQHLAALRGDGFPAEPYAGAEGEGLLVPTDCAFDPLLRCRLLACRLADRGVRFFEHSLVLKVGAREVVCAAGRVRCDRVIIAVDGRLGELVPELAASARPVRLQMLATAPTTEVRIPRPVYARWGYDYWQQLENGRVVLGGFRDQGGDAEWTDEAAPSTPIQGLLERFLRDGLRVHAPITHRWAATVSYSLTGLPVLAEVRPTVIATGAYSGTGNVIGALCGRAAARLALGERTEMAELLAA